MNSKRLFKAIIYMIMISMLTNTIIFASENSDEPVDESKFVPKIKLSTSSTLKINAGTTQEFTLKVKNVGSSIAHGVFVQFVQGQGFPLDAYISETAKSMSVISPSSDREFKIKVTAKQTIEPGTYEATLNYTYRNQFNKEFNDSDKLFFVVENEKYAELTPKVLISEINTNPTTLKAGSTAKITATFENKGNTKAKDVKIGITGLENQTITIKNGLSHKNISVLDTATVETATFDISAASGLKNGNYPITFFTEYKDEFGKEYKNEQPYFVSVGNGSFGTGKIDVLNMNSPTSVFKVSQPIKISFSLKNSGNFEIDDLKITAKTGEGEEIVPTSPSVQAIRNMKPGDIRNFAFQFAATSNAKSRNYPIAFEISYSDGTETSEGVDNIITFSQYAGINVSNPEADKKEEDGEKAKKNVPKIIVSSYSCTPKVVTAGDEFDLFMTFTNTHKDKVVRNIKVSLTVTDKDDKKGASIFSPVNASNTLYVDQIPIGSSASRKIRYYAIADAQPQNYSIDVNFEYEDLEGNELTAQEIIGINVAQPPKLELTELEMPPMASVGEPLFLSMQMYNTGKVNLNNLKVQIEGNFDLEPGMSKTNWYGELESQMNEEYGVTIFATEVGKLDGKVKITYDSPSGESFEVIKDFSMEISEPIPMDPMDMGMEAPAQEEGIPLVYIMIAAAVIIIAGFGVGFLIYKKRKKRKQQELFEFDDEE